MIQKGHVLGLFRPYGWIWKCIYFLEFSHFQLHIEVISNYEVLGLMSIGLSE